MKILPISSINFNGKPKNFATIDKFLSRSAQPQIEDFIWLKDNGVTDVINFRTMYENNLGFEEKDVVESLGMKYHNIPSHTRHPNVENISKFFDTIANIIKNNGKAHIHCKAGADRTGMYAYLYKAKNNIGTSQENKEEWLNRGHHRELFPNLIEWTENFVNSWK